MQLFIAEQQLIIAGRPDLLDIQLGQYHSFGFFDEGVRTMPTRDSLAPADF
jgi:hypothetical protein